MGTYTTYTSIDPLMPGYKLDTTTAQSITSRVIDWAESCVNSGIGTRYNFGSAPFNASATVPPMIRTLTEQITIGYVFKTWSRGAKESITRGDAMLTEAKTQLKLISAGKIDLFATDGSEITERSSSTKIRSNADSYATTFDEDSPLLWRIDPDKIDAISSGRK